MIQKINKKEYDRIRWLIAHKMNQGRRVMIFNNKYYETTGSSLKQIWEWQKQQREALNNQTSLLE